MTAIVGILNKRAAVMAADSAVTVNTDSGTKIYNTATKIFPPLKRAPGRGDDIRFGVLHGNAMGCHL